MSSTIILDKKNYNKLLRKQTDIESEVFVLKEIIYELSKDEIKPAVTRKLEKQSRILDKDGGRRFSSLKEFRRYMKS